MISLDEAKVIYDNPKGHTKEELIECLRTLNSQPKVFSGLMYEVIKDAHKRLGVPLVDITYKSLPQPSK